MKRIKFLWVLLLPLLMQCSSNNSTRVVDPPDVCQWRGPDRGGIYPEKGLLKEWPEKGPELIWSFEGMGMGYSSAAVTSEFVYCAGTEDSTSFIICFSHEGLPVWKSTLGPEWTKTFPGIRSTPLIHHDKGYIINGLGVLYCFNTADGNIVWSKNILEEFDGKNIQHGINENLLVTGDLLFCTPGGKEHNIVALDKNTGNLIWSSPGTGEPSAYCSPQIVEMDGNKFLVTMTFKTLVSVNIENGEVAWTRPLEGDQYGIHACTPIYRDGYLFAQDGYEIGCFMLKLTEGGFNYEEVWKNSLLDETNGHAVVIGDNIFGAAETRRQFVCIDWNTGEVKYNTRDIPNGTVISAEGMLYVTSYPGSMYLLKPAEEKFEFMGEFELPGKDKEHITHPVIRDGRLYIRHKEFLGVYNIKES